MRRPDHPDHLPLSRFRAPCLALLLAVLPAWASKPAAAQPLPVYLADRGPGISTSQFGTYVEPGELIVYPFYEYTRTPKFEYHPSELGSAGSKDFLGKLFEDEALLFVAYGISDRLAVELEGALYAKTTFEKAAEDPSDLPGHQSRRVVIIPPRRSRNWMVTTKLTRRGLYELRRAVMSRRR